MARRGFIVVLLAAALLPLTSSAQTRLFHKGDSGLTFDYSLRYWSESTKWKNYHRTFHSLGALLTYKGTIDLGLQTGGAGEEHYDDDGWTIHVRGLILDPGRSRGWGLEFRSFYSIGSEDDIELVSELPFQDRWSVEVRDRILMTGLRGYYRWVDSPRTRTILGATLAYRFNKLQYLDESDAELLGFQYGSWGFGGNVESMFFGWLHLALEFEYFQSRPPSMNQDWVWMNTLSLGFLFGADTTGGGSHE